MKHHVRTRTISFVKTKKQIKVSDKPEFNIEGVNFLIFTSEANTFLNRNVNKLTAW